MAISTPMLLALVAIYTFFCGTAMYFCVIADPDTSAIAYKIQVALPKKTWGILSKGLNENQLEVLQSLMDLGMVFVYFFVVLGCWTVVFWYIYPWIDRSSMVGSYHKYLGYLVFLACFGSWRLANTASPGIITAKTFPRFDHYPYDNLMFVPNRRCETTKLMRIPRSRFDRLKYNANVPRYDHYCGWVSNTIGEENYRWFLLFLLVHVFMCFYGSAVCMLLFWGEIQDKQLLEITFFDRATGEHVKSTWFIVTQYLFARNAPEFAVLAVMFVMGIALGGFFGYHAYITSYNRTTNEDGKWADIRKWYQKERRRYDDAVNNGLVKATATTPATTSAPEPRDGDVGCTGGLSGLKQEEGDSEYFDPGPVPRNVYDRGFIENWKEVIFPISRRTDALEKGGYSRPFLRKNQDGGSSIKPQATLSASLPSEKTD